VQPPTHPVPHASPVCQFSSTTHSAHPTRSVCRIETNEPTTHIVSDPHIPPSVGAPPLTHHTSRLPSHPQLHCSIRNHHVVCCVIRMSSSSTSRPKSIVVSLFAFEHKIQPSLTIPKPCNIQFLAQQRRKIELQNLDPRLRIHVRRAALISHAALQHQSWMFPRIVFMPRQSFNAWTHPSDGLTGDAGATVIELNASLIIDVFHCDSVHPLSCPFVAQASSSIVRVNSFQSSFLRSFDPG
jgi:hypothetical protein